MLLLSNSFAALPMDTPSPDPATSYITPSPTSNECQLPKAPKARKVSRQIQSLMYFWVEKLCLSHINSSHVWFSWRAKCLGSGRLNITLL